MECPNCKTEVNEADNFCMHCGTKLKKACSCWVKNQNNYDCGENSCPGYALFGIEKKTKAQELSSLIHNQSQ